MFNTLTVGRRIAELRKEKNLTQMELADAMGVSYQAVSNRERGNSMPDISKLADLAALLDITIDVLLGNEGAVTLAKHVLAGDEKAYVQEEKVGLDELAEIAPILKPVQTGELFEAITVKKEAPFTLDELISVAPFLDSHLLDRIIADIEHVHLNELAGIAPFLSREALDGLARRAGQSGRLSDLIPLAPFLSRQILDELAATVEEVENLGKLAGLAPFLSSDALGVIARRAATSGSLKELSSLAPFLPKEVLHEMAEKLIKDKDFSVLSSIGPFL